MDVRHPTFCLTPDQGLHARKAFFKEKYIVCGFIF